MLEFQKRYHELFYESKSATKESDQHDWLYWSLQHQQFATWRRGLLPHTSYHFWMARRVLEQSETDDMLGLKSWELHKHYFKETHYYDFMNQLLEVKATTIGQARERAKQTLWAYSYPITKLRFIHEHFFPEGPIFYLSKTWTRIIISLLFLGGVLAACSFILS